MSKHPLLEALLPLADILGIQILDKDEISESDLHLLWEGEVVGGVRRHNLMGGLLGVGGGGGVGGVLKVKLWTALQSNQDCGCLMDGGV